MGTSLAVISFPRSGNNYLISYLNQIYPNYDLKASHRVQDLSLENCLTTIRKPNEVIPSYLTFFKQKISESNRLERVIAWYIRFYNEVLNHSLIVLDFYKMISNTNYVFDIMTNLLPNPKIMGNSAILNKNSNKEFYTLLDEKDPRLIEANRIYNKIKEKAL